MNIQRSLLLCLLLFTCWPQDAPADQWIKGRVDGYRGLFPFHVAVLSSRDLTHPDNPVAWGTADPSDGRFDIRVPDDLDSFYLLGQLDRERMGQRLNGQHLFFLRKLPTETASIQNKRLLFDLGDMELAHVVRDAGTGAAAWLALALGLLLFGIGFAWYRRLIPQVRTEPLDSPKGGRALWGILLATTLPTLPQLGSESLELLEFTYLHEGLRPESIFSLLFDPISAELSHPPLWPLVLRAMASISQAEWWLRLPSVLAHMGTVLVAYRIAATAIDRPTGLATSAAIGLLPVAFYYGQDATPYAMIGLVSSLAVWSALQERWRQFAATLVLGFFIHYTVAVLGLAIGIGLFWAWRHDKNSGRMRRALIGFALILPLPLVWSVHFFRTFLASGMSTRLMSVDYLPDPGFLSYVGHFGAVVLGLPPTLKLLLPLALGLVLWGGYITARRHPLLGRIVLIQLVMIIAYVLFVHSMYMRFANGRVFYAYRWTTAFLPCVSVCIGMGLVDLWSRKRWLGGSLALVWLVGAIAQDASILRQAQRPDQWAAIERIEAEKQREDAFCALPAVYYGQLLNYHLNHREPADLMAWPVWQNEIYGPLHPRNTTIESLSRHLAFKRLWVAVFDERMFGTPKFDATTSAHQLDWMRTHLIPDGEWQYDHLALYRFRVPPRPELIWQNGVLELDFSQTLRLFRYFPEHLHTQQTGLIMTAPSVSVRVPSPSNAPESLHVQLSVLAGESLSAADLTLDGVTLSFESTIDGGQWSGQVPVTGALIDLRLDRSPRLATIHRNTTLQLTHEPPH